MKAARDFASLIHSSFLVSMNRTKSTPELDGPEVNGTANQEEKIQSAVPPLLICPELGDLTRKNWTYLTNEVSYDCIHLLLLF